MNMFNSGDARAAAASPSTAASPAAVAPAADLLAAVSRATIAGAAAPLNISPNKQQAAKVGDRPLARMPVDANGAVKALTLDQLPKEIRRDIETKGGWQSAPEIRPDPTRGVY